MTPMELNFDPAETYQSLTVNIEPDGTEYRFEVELRYLENVDKWYISILDAETGNAHCRYVPVVASFTVLNDLLGTFRHKNIGSLFCFPLSSDQRSGDPQRDTLGQYSIVWSDHI